MAYLEVRAMPERMAYFIAWEPMAASKFSMVGCCVQASSFRKEKEPCCENSWSASLEAVLCLALADSMLSG